MSKKQKQNPVVTRVSAKTGKRFSGEAVGNYDPSLNPVSIRYIPDSEIVRHKAGSYDVDRGIPAAHGLVYQTRVGVSNACESAVRIMQTPARGWEYENYPATLCLVSADTPHLRGFGKSFGTFKGLLPESDIKWIRLRVKGLYDERWMNNAHYLLDIPGVKDVKYADHQIDIRASWSGIRFIIELGDVIQYLENPGKGSRKQSTWERIGEMWKEGAFPAQIRSKKAKNK